MTANHEPKILNVDGATHVETNMERPTEENNLTKSNHYEELKDLRLSEQKQKQHHHHQQHDDNDKETKKIMTCLGHVRKAFNYIVPYGGIASSVFNLTSVCLGAGILGLPAATRSSGLVIAFIYLFVLALFGTYSLHILGKTMSKTGYRTFEHMAKGLMGNRFDYFVTCIRWLNSFGAPIAYIISIGDICGPILINSSGVSDKFKTLFGRRVITSIIWIFILLPLVLPKMVNSLRYVSAIAVCFVVYFVIMIVVHSSMGGLDNIKHMDGTEIRLFNSGNTAIRGLGVFMFAFVCQINCYEIYWEMKDRSEERFTICAILTMLLAFCAYGLTAFFGYIEFGNKATGSILLMYNPVSEIMIMVGYVGILIKLCASYALQTMAYRNTIYYLIGWEVETVPYWKHIIFVVISATIILICGLFIPKIHTVFGFVGAICGGFLSYVFPALFYLYSGNWTLKSVGLFHYVATYVLLIAGVVGIVFGTIATIDNTING